MNTSAFLTLYRSLTRHRLYAALNIGGLALGIAACLVLFLFVQFERGFDRGIAKADEIYVARSEFKLWDLPSDLSLQLPNRFLDLLQSDYPEVEGGRYRGFDDTPVRNGSDVISEDIAKVDPGFMKLFDYPAVAGDPVAALSRPDGAVVTQSAARRYLGDGSALGKTITLVFDGKDKTYRVGAVLRDIPRDMTYRNDIFVAMPESESAFSWGKASTTTFVRFAEPAQAKAMEARMPAFLDAHPGVGFGDKPSDSLALYFKPLTDLHLAQDRDRTVVAVLGIVGLLTLLIAVVNYVNLATARAGLRAREVAMRKVLGATRAALMRQFLGEAIATVAVAALIALALAEIALPFVNAAGGTTLSIHYWGRHSVLLPLAGLILVVGTLSGLYPAFALARFQPSRILAAARSPSGGKAGAFLRKALVVVQFAIATAFMIGTITLIAQTRHLQSADLGFDRDGLLMLTSYTDHNLDTAQRADLLRTARELPGVEGIGLSRLAPGGGSMTIYNVKNETAPGITVNLVDVGPGFFDTYNARLLAGRFLGNRFGKDDSGGNQSKNKVPVNVLANKAALAVLGFSSAKDAIGKDSSVSFNDRPTTIVGVVADMRFGTPREAVQPTLYYYDAQAGEGYLPVLRADPAALPKIEKALADRWSDIAPQVPFRAETARHALYRKYYENDAQRTRLFTIGAVLAVVIGCIGLYGLAAFDTSRRIKEIGIRKVLGASTRDILRLLLGQFLRPVILANIIAWPLAYFAMRKWLSGFDDRVVLSPMFFVAAALLALVIAAATIIGQALRVARAAPARSLRYERRRKHP